MKYLRYNFFLAVVYVFAAAVIVLTWSNPV